MKARRFGTIHAFVVGTIKGIMWSAVPVAAAVVALAYQAHGWSDLNFRPRQTGEPRWRHGRGDRRDHLE
jgi:hypothetical protein